MNRLLKCKTCREYITHAKEQIKTHEVRYHAYQSASYEQHHHIPLSKKEKAVITVRAEEKMGTHNFIGKHDWEA